MGETIMIMNSYNSDGYRHANGEGLFYKEEYTIRPDGKTLKITSWYDNATRKYRQECREELDYGIE